MMNKRPMAEGTRHTKTESIDFLNHPEPPITVLENGYILNINKPVNWTSFAVVQRIRKITAIRKVGHAGTLDPFATGVLLVCLHRATKLINNLMNLSKEYEAELQLGKSTDTLDVTGSVTAETPVPELSDNTITKVLQSFTGRIKQRIPDYSAARINGQRSYKRARRGEQIPDTYKTVEIYKLDLIQFQDTKIQFRVLCERGTYVRTLGADIAQALGTVGHLSNLNRTRIGHYSIQNALSVSEFERQWQKIKSNENLS